MERIGTQIKGKDVTLGGPKTSDTLRRMAAYHAQREEVLAAQGRPQMAREAHRQYKRYLRSTRAASAVETMMKERKYCSGSMCVREISGEEVRFRGSYGEVFCCRNCMESYYRRIEKDRVGSAVLI